MWGWELISGILFSDDYEFFVDHMISFLKYEEGRIYFWYSIFRQFHSFGFCSHSFISHDVFSDTFSVGDIGRVGLGMWGWVPGNNIVGVGTWGRKPGDESVG